MVGRSAPEAPDFANGMFLTATNLGTTVGTTLCGGLHRGGRRPGVRIGAVAVCGARSHLRCLAAAEARARGPRRAYGLRCPRRILRVRPLGSTLACNTSGHPCLRACSKYDNGSVPGYLWVPVGTEEGNSIWSTVFCRMAGDKISVIGLGSAGLHSATDAEVERTIDEAVDAGVNHFDFIPSEAKPLAAMGALCIAIEPMSTSRCISARCTVAAPTRGRRTPSPLSPSSSSAWLRSVPTMRTSASSTASTRMPTWTA